MQDRTSVRNIGTLAHVDHGKTTLSDNLLASAGLISPKVAAKALALDYVEIEQLRQMTVKAANVSLLHEYEGKPYVINLVDTPGHVDFTGHVTRSLRVMDGGVVVVDSVEGVMTQTETVLRQAMEERVRPLLFINKVDRLIKELKLSPAEIQEQFFKIIRDFNALLDIYAEPQFREKWKVNPAAGQVAFGSALHKWGLTIPLVQKLGIKFSDIVDAYNAGQTGVAQLAERAPVHAPILDMVVQHIPNPIEAQKYRIERVWKGDLNSEVGKAMVNCDPNGPLVICVIKIIVDQQAGIVTTGRVFSGTLHDGDSIYMVGGRREARVNQVSLYMGLYREIAPTMPAGNIVAALGLENAKAGDTLVTPTLSATMAPFERMKYISEPVVTIAIEPKHSKDLPRLIDTLQKMAIEDPTLRVRINQETGEYLVAGMGSLHLEIAMWDLKQRTGGLEVVTTPPIVVYRESIREKAGPFEGKSPNKHNRLYLAVQPVDEKTMKLMHESAVFDTQDSRERAKILREQAGWDTDEARGIWAIDEFFNIILDVTKGLQYLREIKDTILAGFRWSMEAGPLAQEPVRGVLVKLVDANVHEDPAHRGPAQIMPATKNSIFAGLLTARPVMLEPILKLDVKVAQDYVGEVLRIIQSKRGKIVEMDQQGNLSMVKGEMPVSETFDLSEQMRSATQGKAFWATEFSHWSPVPESLTGELIRKIRERKGLPPEVQKAEEFMSA